MTEAVLIVGAGPTGLVLALWLTKLGVRVRIVDAAAEPGTTSRALAVQARTLELYGQAGLADAVVEAGRKVENLSFWVEGRRKSRMSIGRIGEDLSPYSFALVYPQDAHERLLTERLEAAGVAVERNTRLVAFDQDGSGVRATLRRNGGAEESVAAEWLAGCDGASSTVRQELGIGFPGGTYTGQFYVADVEAAGPSVDGDLHIDLEDADFLLMFPMRGSGSVRLVGVAHAGGAGDPTFDEVAPRVLENLRLEVRKVNWFSTYRVHHRVADRFRAGRAFLLGDAAHIHSPVGGQGMNTGIGDAVNLAWKLAAVGGGRAREALLATYEPERIAFARRLVATTDRIFSVVTRRGALARIVRTRVVPVAVPWLFRFAPVRRFQFRTISQIGIEYRRSALSEGSAGRVHGGDRLPWVRTGESEDNFAPLASMKWQVHVYGEPPQGVAETCAALELALCPFPWRDAMRRSGFERDALYLVRPDGYVALASAGGGAALRAYFAQRPELGR